MGKFKCLCISLHQCLEQACVKWSIFTDVFLHLLVSIRYVIEGEHPAFLARKKLFLFLPLLNPPSDLAAIINFCSVQMSHRVPDIHGWSKGQHSLHWQVNVLMCPCKHTKCQVPSWVPAMCPWCIDDGLEQQRCEAS